MDGEYEGGAGVPALPSHLFLRGYADKKKQGSVLVAPTPGKPGDKLLSHRVLAALPSSTEGLTAVFGMGTGISPRP